MPTAAWRVGTREVIWQEVLNLAFRSIEPNWRIALPLTQTQLIAAVADRADLSKADARRVLEALDDVVLEELGNAQKVRIGGLVQLTVRVKPATKKRCADVLASLGLPSAIGVVCPVPGRDRRIPVSGRGRPPRLRSCQLRVEY